MNRSNILIIATVAALLVALFFISQRQELSSMDVQSSTNPVPTAHSNTPNDVKTDNQFIKQAKSDIDSPIIVCDIDETPQDIIVAQNKLLKKRDDELRNIIKHATDAESKLVYLMTSGKVTDEVYLQKLTQLDQEFDDHNLISFELLTACTSGNHHCSDKLIEKIAEQHSDNSAAWLLLATHHFNQGRFQQAINAINEADKAPIYHDYWTDYLAVMSNVYDRTGAKNDKTLLDIKTGYIAALPIPSYRGLFDHCQKVTLDDLGLVESCLSATQLLTHNHSTMVAKMIGLSLQKKIYKKFDDEEKLAQVEQQHNEMLKFFNRSAQALDLLSRHDNVMMTMFDEYKRLGEYAALEVAIEQAVILSNDSTIDACNPTSNHDL